MRKAGGRTARRLGVTCFGISPLPAAGCGGYLQACRALRENMAACRGVQPGAPERALLQWSPRQARQGSRRVRPRQACANEVVEVGRGHLGAHWGKNCPMYWDGRHICELIGWPCRWDTKPLRYTLQIPTLSGVRRRARISFEILSDASASASRPSRSATCNDERRRTSLRDQPADAIGAFSRLSPGVPTGLRVPQRRS